MLSTLLMISSMASLKFYRGIEVLFVLINLYIYTLEGSTEFCNVAALHEKGSNT